MANLITVARLILLFVVIWLIYVGNVQVVTASMMLIIIVFASDGLDGWVARKRGSTSTFGAVFDILGDRIVENALWVIFSDLDLIPVWIPLMVLTRGFIVDGVRSMSYAEGKTPFGKNNMMKSAFTEWLTAGRFMRSFFGWAKAAGFVFLTGLAGKERLDTGGTFLGTLYDQRWYLWLGWGLVWAAVILTIVRGVPVIVDAWAHIQGDAEQPLSA
ncbi:MAG TPA: CDP-alcohol phosphatidyltransferase family protein [Thermomicrobiales bacterium]|nr:CDP-alcohol phosphatidyltransferase family protein [Thermomicrobiales bacterium]